MDAITLLKNDHRTVEKLFKRFEKAGERAYAEKRKAVELITEELSIHAAIEEMLFYPVIRATVPDIEDVTLESLEEHHIVKWVLSEVDGMDPKDERYVAKVTVLIENVRHHVEEEETDLFPKVRDALGRRELNQLGDAMVEAKGLAPTHPHPRSPDTPPGNIVAGVAAGVTDKVTDTVKGAAQGAVSTAQDLITRFSGSEPGRKPAPHGSPTAKKAARRTKAATRKVADKAEQKVAAKTSAAKRTATTSKTAAKKTVAAKKTAAKRTATTSKTTAKKTVAAKKTAAKKAASRA